MNRTSGNGTEGSGRPFSERPEAVSSPRRPENPPPLAWGLSIALAFCLALIFLPGCGDDILLHQSGDFEYTLHGERQVAPGWSQWRAWNYVSECTGIMHPTPQEVTWWKVDRIVEHPGGRSISGLANFTRWHIYIQKDSWNDWRISGAELLHLMLGIGVHDDDPEYQICNPMRYPRES